MYQSIHGSKRKSQRCFKILNEIRIIIITSSSNPKKEPKTEIKKIRTEWGGREGKNQNRKIEKRYMFLGKHWSDLSLDKKERRYISPLSKITTDFKGSEAQMALRD